jgi:hypothetical protein
MDFFLDLVCWTRAQCLSAPFSYILYTVMMQWNLGISQGIQALKWKHHCVFGFQLTAEQIVESVIDCINKLECIIFWPNYSIALSLLIIMYTDRHGIFCARRDDVMSCWLVSDKQFHPSLHNQTALVCVSTMAISIPLLSALTYQMESSISSFTLQAGLNSIASDLELPGLNLGRDQCPPR